MQVSMEIIAKLIKALNSIVLFPHIQITYDPNHALEALKSFTFRDVVQGRVAIEETLSDGNNQIHNNESSLTKTRGHTPATPLNDSFTFLLKAGNVQPAKGELHFTIFPHHQMRHGTRGVHKAHGASHERTTPHLGAHNSTTLGAGHRDSVTHGMTAESSHPHILSNKNHNKTQRKVKPHSRWGNRTRSHGGRLGSIPEVAVEEGHVHAPQPHTPPVPEMPVPISPPIPDLVQVEILPRPASDPLLIILPLLACLLLIIILVVLILVFRHRKEKQARQRLMHELAAVQLPTEDSPYLGQPERSMAMPNVLVTQLGSASCPTSPRIPMSPRRSLAPGMTFWGPFESNLAGRDGNIRGRNNSERDSGDMPQVSPAGFKTSWRSQSPTLKDSQYWV